MNLVLLAAFIAVCGATKLDRTYLPPPSSQNAGGPPGSLQTPFITSSTNQGSQQIPFGRTSDSNPSQGNQLPSGSFENEYQGVVVEAAAPGTRASNQPTGLGGPRINYGSTDSKVGEAAFRGTKVQARPATQKGGYQSQAQFRPFQSQGAVTTDQASNTIKSHMNIGLNNFNYGFETENGIKKEENGVSDDGVQTQGGYSYTGDDGKVYSVMYTADKNGYRPMGSHLPTPPPIPVEILESLEKNARDEANGIKDDGSYDAEKYNKEDDAQSVTNGNYNDRQSNKFGERPGFGGGASAFINQDQQGFVRPNVQGQFNSYDSSKDSSSTQFFGTGVSGQSNKVEQPESNAFFNQDQQGFVRPNVQGQFNSYDSSEDSSSTQFFDTGVSGQSNKVEQPGSNAFFNQDQHGFARPNIQGPSSSYDFSLDSSSTKPDINKFETGTPNNGNILVQNGQTTQFGNRFGAQYLPPRPPGNFLDSNSFLQIDSSKVDFYNNFNNAQSQSDQKFQDQGQFEKPVSTLTTPNSFGTSFGQGISNNNLFPSTQGLNYFGTDGNSNRPQNNGAFFQTSMRSSSIGSHPSPQSQGSFSQTSFLSSADTKKENKNSTFSNRFSSTFSSQITPTKQPDLILTTPLEKQEQQTNSGSSLVATSSIDSQPKKPYSINSVNSNLSSNERLSDGQFNSNLPGQAQGIDNSYNYNLPSNPFNTAPGTPSGSVYSVGQPFGSLFSNTPEGSVFSFEYQGATGSYNYPQSPTLAPVAPTSITTDQSNGITQASISPFPSIKPTSSSQMNSGEVYEYTKPVQELPASPQEENAGESNSESNQQTSVPSSQNKDTVKPQASLDSNKQFGQRFPATSISAFGQQSFPSQFGMQSTFGQKPTQSQFSGQGTSSFGQIPTLSTLGAQTGSSFGQKPTQQQFDPQTTFSFGQQTTPSRIGAQPSLPFGQTQSFKPFIGPTSTSLNQQTTTGYSAQTSTSFGQKPTQPQNSFSFGQQTTPSRFGIQTGSSFGLPTLTPFGSQTSISVGQTPSQPQSSFPFGKNPSEPQSDAQTSFSFGSQRTSTRFGVQTGSPYEQKPNPPTLSIRPSCCTQTSSSFGPQTKPSRFGIQTDSIFSQKPTQAQNSFSFGPQTTPSRFGVQTSSSLGQQTTLSKFDILSIPSSGQQTTFDNGDDSKPSKLQPSTFNSQISQESVENTSSNEVYQYNKPTTSIPTNQQSLDGTQSSQRPSAQPDKESFSSSSSTSVDNDSSNTNQQSKVPLFPRFPEQSSVTDSQFGSVQPTNSQFVAPTSSSEQSFDSKESTTSDFSSTSSTSFPSSPNSQSALNTQKQEQSQNSESGEVFHYNKPTPALQSSSQNENIQFGQNTQNGQIAGQSGQNELDTSKPITSFLPQSNDRFDNDQLPTQNDEDLSQTQTDSRPEKPSSSLGILPSSHPFPHLAVYSACCRGKKPQNSQGSQPLSGKIPSSPLTGSLGGNSFGFNKNDRNQDTNNSGLIENKFSSQGFGVQKDTPSTQKLSSSSLGVLPSSHPFPHLAIYSACCRGNKPQNSQVSQSLSGKEPSSSLNGNLGGNSFGFNKNDSNQDTNNSGLIENKFGNQGFGVQKDTPIASGNGEEFGGPRNPPQFDETGYHY